MSFKLSSLQRAKLLKEKERLEFEFEKQRRLGQKVVSQIVLENWNNFYEISMQMAKADGTMNFKEIQLLSVTEFYKLKQWLQKIKKKGRTTTNSNET